MKDRKRTRFFHTKHMTEFNMCGYHPKIFTKHLSLQSLLKTAMHPCTMPRAAGELPAARVGAGVTSHLVARADDKLCHCIVQTYFLIVLKRKRPLATLPRASEGHWVPKRRRQKWPNCHFQAAQGRPCRRRKRGPRRRLARSCLWPTFRCDGFKRAV